jgi:predicted HicB family RNase H-like nuclease
MKTAKYSKALTVALHPDSYEQIKMITDAKHISMAEWVRDAVDAALEKEKQKEDETNEQ